jgi:WhiB family transcriptional regulator, redox-sensing transcriptional regulator
MAPQTLAPDTDTISLTAIKAVITPLLITGSRRIADASQTPLPCQEENASLWFSNAPAELNLAKAYCRGCRNRHACLAGALERAEAAGVWGGEIFEQGRIIEFKRPRGRPRKSPGPDDGVGNATLSPPALLPGGG